MCKVSIIVPVYNGEKVIGRCLDSILKQDQRDIEVIVIDDGSVDNSYEIISDYAKKDERIVAIHKENGGVSSTRNKALDLAKGEYIQFIDVDDWLPFDSTKLLLRSMEENDVELVVGDFYRVIDNKTSKKGTFKKGGVITRNLYADKMMLSPADFYYGVLWNKLYKKSIIDEYHIRMDEDIDYCEDVIFNLEYLLHTEKIYILKSPVYYYHLTEGSLVSQNLNISNTVKMKLDVIKYYDSFYKNIMDPNDYETRKPFIYSYLFAFSTDAFNIPFIDNVKKLGEEAGEKIYYDVTENNYRQFIYDYFSISMIKKLLSTVAVQHKLDLTDMTILYYLYTKKESASFDEIVSICNLKYSTAAVSITKLVALSYIKIGEISLTNKNIVMYSYISGKLDGDLRQIDADYDNVCFKDLSEKDIEEYKRLQKLIFNNLRKTIQE